MDEQERDNKERALFQNLTNNTDLNSMLANDDIKFNATHKGTNGQSDVKNGKQAPAIPVNTAYIVKEGETNEPPLFSSTA